MCLCAEKLLSFIGNTKGNVVRPVFIFTAIFFSNLRNFYVTFTTKTWPEIEKLLLLGLEAGFFWKKRACIWELVLTFIVIT